MEALDVKLKMGGATLPIIHQPINTLLNYFALDPTDSVDRQKCECSCWDRFLKGKSKQSYQNVYINLTFSSLVIWVVIVLGAVWLYETIQAYMQLFRRGNIRVPFFVLFSMTIVTQFNSWYWIIIYLNEDDYSHLLHQTLLTISELCTAHITFTISWRLRRVDFKSIVSLYCAAIFRIIWHLVDKMPKKWIIDDTPGVYDWIFFLYILWDIVHLGVPMYFDCYVKEVWESFRPNYHSERSETTAL